MSERETVGQSDEWYTPPEVFEALGEEGESRKDLEARIEALADFLDQLAWKNLKRCADRADGMAEAQKDAAGHLRSLLTDKEGEQ